MNYKSYFILLIGISFFSCNPNQIGEQSLEEDSGEILLSASQVVSNNDKVKTGDIESKTVAQKINCTGMIDLPPTDLISIHSKMKGQIISINYLPGDYVKKGTVLASIENPQIVEKQRILLETKSNLAFAEKDFERKKILKSGNATTEKSFDESNNQVDLLSARYKGLKKELELLGVNMERLENQKGFQSTFNIYASGAGYVHEVLVNKGQMINPEIKIMEIANNQHLHLELQVLSKDVGSIKKSQKVSFSISGQSQIYNGEVVKINPMINKTNATLQVHCHINTKDNKILIPGLFVNAQIETGNQEMKGLKLSALIKEGEDYFAYKVIQNAFVKTSLKNVSIVDDFAVFDGEKNGTWVIEGAYYVE